MPSIKKSTVLKRAVDYVRFLYVHDLLSEAERNKAHARIRKQADAAGLEIIKSAPFEYSFRKKE